jgi:hypothetical protein
MSDMNEHEETLASGEVPIPGAEGSANEEDGQEKDADDITNADNIRQAHAVVTARVDAPPDNTNLPRTRLTFIVEAPVARNSLGPTEDPRPSELRPLDRYEQFAMETDQPAGSSDLGNAASIDAADLLRESLGLTEEGSALHDTTKSALGFHETWLKSQMSRAGKEPTTADSAITEALLRRLKKTSISDDEDEAGDTFEMRANKNLIRRRKNLRLIEKKKQEGEAKNSLRSASDEPKAALPP